MMKYYLGENHLTETVNDFIAHIQSGGSYDMEELIKRMLQSGTTITRADILAVTAILEETIIAILREGNTIATSLFRISFSITGG